MTIQTLQERLDYKVQQFLDTLANNGEAKNVTLTIKIDGEGLDIPICAEVYDSLEVFVKDLVEIAES